ncbi:glycosyltransferase family 8 protein [Halalkalibacter akibai]|uniref:Glycosyltransferase n=1 Tax=Halalkalibacter akibai (strain ATCC 43226 / DSM 21942 / CIP 109018 / JCM 9157 / 1139) TaxID=1236973 RepID=W4QTE5_HALA3|nr:glycosyltransferase family 8 protein [Halalkalibacter akibai]GAE35376.1 glycosyltransferase [Halalkalibacter akibai JCM 9157]
MDTIHIVTAADNNYVDPLGVTFISLLENKHSENPLRFYIIDGGISDEKKEVFHRIKDKYNVDVIFLTIDKMMFEGFHVSGHINETSYYRILIPHFLDKDVEKVIYLDSDLLIKQDITKLWNKNIKNVYLRAVEDVGVIASQTSDVPIPKPYSYLNAGVLLINLKKWRKKKISDRLVQFIRENPTMLRYHDQDALNALLYDKWHKLNPKWNVQKVFYYFQGEEYVKVRENPAIVHFTEPVKPWHSDYSIVELKEEYEFYLQKFFDFED